MWESRHKSIHQTTGIIQRNFCVDILLFSPSVIIYTRRQILG